MEALNKESPVYRVLLVEDNPGDAFLVQKRLGEAHGMRFDIIHIDTLQETLAVLADQDFDILLLDLNLSDSERMKTVKSVSAASDAAIIVLTSQPDEDLALKAIQAGIQDFLGKDKVNTPELLNAIRFALERQSAKNRLFRLAYRDSLTGLSNRNAFIEECNAALAHSGEGQRQAFHLLHIRNLKELVIEEGLHVAEAALKAAANRLYGALQAKRIFARMDSDHFGLLQADAQHEGHALYLARRISECLDDPVEAEGVSVTLDMAIGISFYPDHGNDFDQLYHFAVLALEQVAQDDSKPYRVYQE